MKMLVNVILPIEPFNSMVRNGSVGEIIGRVIDDIKPEHHVKEKQHKQNTDTK